MIFLWCWTGLFTATVLPIGIAMLRGWAPRRARARWSRARLKVHGAALLVMYVAALVHPVFRLSGVPRDDTDFFVSLLSPALIFLALGLQAGAGLSDWFNRRELERG
ncbi:hypothetical protein [Streptomyces sp. NPDC005407]|uniref:hypothetical protein n=1 Tax=Streptomyces sp. NPDC005407 TaxID=3155340 RepID=UPI0033A27F3F